MILKRGSRVYPPASPLLFRKVRLSGVESRLPVQPENRKRFPAVATHKSATMPIRDLDSMLKRLETDATDELSELEAVGADVYETGQLLRLRGQWEVKNTLFHVYQRFFIRIMGVSPLWLVLWFVCRLIGLSFLGLFFLALFPLSFALFLSGMVFMQQFFKGRGHLDRVGSMLAEELQRRQKK